MICVFLRVPFGSGVKGKGKPKKSVSGFLTFGVDVRLDPVRTSEETLADCPRNVSAVYTLDVRLLVRS